LDPNQKTFVPEYNFDLPIQVQNQESTLLTNLRNPFKTVLSQWKTTYKWSDNDADQVEILPIGRKNSLYASLLCLIHQRYNLTCTYNQRMEMIDEFIRFIISQIDKNNKIKSFIRETRLRSNQLIEEIKNDHYQTPDVIFYLSLLFDINIIIMSSTELELYHCDNTYDNCKPHIIFYKDSSQIYYPVCYKTLTHNQLLTYHDNAIIRSLVDSFTKKIICKKNYIKKVTKKTQSDIDISDSINRPIKNETVIELRKIAESRGIDIRKISEVSGKRIYKTKSELLADLEE